MPPKKPPVAPPEPPISRETKKSDKGAKGTKRTKGTKSPAPIPETVKKPATKEPIKPVKKPKSIKRPVPKPKRVRISNKHDDVSKEATVLRNDLVLFDDLEIKIPDGMKAKEVRFAHEYVIDSNGTQAAIRAGYSEASAYTIASELLRKPHIAAYVKSIEQPLLEKLGITAEYVLRKYKAIADANQFDFMVVDTETGLASVDLRNATREQLATIKEYKVVELPPQKMSIIDPLTGEPMLIEREVITASVKLHDPLVALKVLGQKLGIIDKDATSMPSVDALTSQIEALERTIREKRSTLGITDADVPDIIDAEYSDLTGQ